MSLNCHVVSTWVLRSFPVFEKASFWTQRWCLRLLVPGTVISSERDNFIVLRAYSSPLTWRQRWPILFHNSLTSDSVVLKETSKSFFSFMLKPASSKCPSSQVTCDKNTSATPLCCRLPHIAVEETVRQRAQNARGHQKWTEARGVRVAVTSILAVLFYLMLQSQLSELWESNRLNLKMPGLKKLKKGKKFNYGRNRSRVRKQQEKTSKFNVAVKVDCQAMKVNISHI